MDDPNYSINYVLPWKYKILMDSKDIVHYRFWCPNLPMSYLHMAKVILWVMKFALCVAAPMLILRMASSGQVWMLNGVKQMGT